MKGRLAAFAPAVLLVTVPSVMFGGLTLLSMLIGRAPGYADNPFRHDLWSA